MVVLFNRNYFCGLEVICGDRDKLFIFVMNMRLFLMNENVLFEINLYIIEF